MSTYVCSDFHGCFDKAMQLLEAIGFSEADQMIIAGDYIDRGTQNYEMLNWAAHAPDNVLLLCGNHDKEFVYYVEQMRHVMETEIADFDVNDPDAADVLYRYTKLLASRNDDGQQERQQEQFDRYGTIQQLIHRHHVTFQKLLDWAALLDNMPYFFKLKLGGRQCIIVHAGYIDSVEQLNRLNAPGGPAHGNPYHSREEFFLNARGDVCFCGGPEHGMVVAGHTPTIAAGLVTFNDGSVFRYYDEEKDCIYYDIDCGCAYAPTTPNARLACLRLDDEKVFYV